MRAPARPGARPALREPRASAALLRSSRRPPEVRLAGGAKKVASRDPTREKVAPPGDPRGSARWRPNSAGAPRGQNEGRARPEALRQGMAPEAAMASPHTSRGARALGRRLAARHPVRVAGWAEPPRRGRGRVRHRVARQARRAPPPARAAAGWAQSLSRASARVRRFVARQARWTLQARGAGWVQARAAAALVCGCRGRSSWRTP